MVLRARFEHDLSLPDHLSIYKNGQLAYTMVDNGISPDRKAKDGIFTTTVYQNPDSLASEIQERLHNIQTRGYVMDFVGHSGKLVKYRDVKTFNKSDFDHFQLIELDPLIIEGTTSCDMDENTILKQNSLFITDLSVVEDLARTYNVVSGQGAPQGAWTFGELIKNMAGGYADEANPTEEEKTKVRTFIKEWIIALYTQFSFNTISAPSVDKVRVLRAIAKQWLVKARANAGMPAVTIPISGTDTESWKTYFDDFTTDNQVNTLLSVAPFKLTAIVNRVDLRGNLGYGSGNSGVNGGETRFIFSLVQTISSIGAGNGSSNIGKIVRFYPTSTDGQAPTLIDWNGMNVILEYSNVTASECDVKDLGQQWKDLSTHTLGSSDYLTALQNITDLVTTRHANPDGINGSAISQVRTNTKLFHNHDVSNPKFSRWTLREFKLNETTGYLENAPTLNMPFASNNIRRNSKYEANASTNLSSEQIVNWIYASNAHKVSVLNGNHNLPHNQLNPVSVSIDEMQSYYALGFWHENFPDNIYDDDNYDLSASPDDKAIRHQLSLNTCMGCHGAETKTLFTMVRPLGYGEAADYWSAIPSTTTGLLHNPEGIIDNAGTTFDPNHPDANGRRIY